ncbi:MAG: histidine kinase [Pseudomonadota bacterium]|nr:histidine kinase [Pseudomonadota bacterium]
MIPVPLATFARRLRRDASGLALLEFAFGAPLVMSVGLYAIESANLALSNMRVSQAALNLADNAARVGLMNSLSTEQLRETDMNDVLNAAKLQGQGWDLTGRGRITVSSLEADSSGNQTIHWQRCIGARSGAGYDSSYGITSTTNKSNGTTYDPTAGVNTGGATDNSASHPGSAAIGTTAQPVTGMGDVGSPVQAPPTSGVIFVEINYDYKPVVSSLWLPGGSAKLHYVASFIVRDRRDFTEIYNPSPAAARSTCDLHNS